MFDAGRAAQKAKFGGEFFVADWPADENGTVFVLATDEFKILGNYALGDGGAARSSVVLTHGLVMVRTAEKLLAFGSK